MEKNGIVMSANLCAQLGISTPDGPLNTSNLSQCACVFCRRAVHDAEAVWRSLDSDQLCCQVPPAGGGTVQRALPAQGHSTHAPQVSTTHAPPVGAYAAEAPQVSTHACS